MSSSSIRIRPQTQSTQLEHTTLRATQTEDDVEDGCPHPTQFTTLGPPVQTGAALNICYTQETETETGAGP
jgi:hypothetical protein